MSDRELLELAAKAAGIELKGWTGTAIHGHAWGAMLTKYGVGERTWWNPLTDDGDALRLASKVGLSIDCWESGATVTYDLDGVQMSQLDEVGEPCAATRRAIVRAAAEIAKATP